MEHLENDMDDLFQKAGQLYPLKTSGSDWDTVLGKVYEEGFGDQTGVSGNKRAARIKRRWLLLLLLIPIGFGSVIYFSSSKKLLQTSAINTVKNNSAKMHSIRSNDKSEPGISDKSKKTNSNNPVTVIGEPVRGNTEITTKTGGSSNKNDIHLKTMGPNTAVTEDINTLSPSENPENSQDPSEQILAKKPLSLSVSETNEIIVVEGKTLTSAKSGSANIVTPVSSPKTNKASPNKGFYVGFIAGPDLSTVKFQSVEQLGYSLGALIGYRLNGHFSIETGLLWDKKYYYTEGKYFSKDQLYVPPSASILNVNGNCNMFEIPISLRYDFTTNAHHGFFVSGGMSSYLMRQQNYTAIVANSSSQWSAPISSSEPANYFFSIFQLSAGYEFAVNGKTKIRIEPYVKMPLQGIGIGSLPISSTGLYLGITHSFR